ncbi:unnamed protein product [Litomosoides sigmodontis]|uniref:Uncharacterized protein n=1 Tax=Litomosoides sigmodontis TaxID=42156 RepID=A0A3P6TSF7_LITSI|nr:unnamed protein product [Litomosoides sigmodontis]
MLSRQIDSQIYRGLLTTFTVRFAKRHLKGALFTLLITMISLMVGQLKNIEQNRSVVVEKICSNEFQFCLLIKDETFGDGGQ